jgi:HrpA-like RNA helicase
MKGRTLRNKQTRLLNVTDGVLLNQLREDPLLKSYEAVILDETHERNSNTDIILSCLRGVGLRYSTGDDISADS